MSFFGPPPDFSLGTTLAHNWWVIAARGVFGLIIGFITFFFPGPTLLWTVGLLVVYLILGGILAIVAAVRAARKHERLGFLIFEGIIGIVAGLVIGFLPGITVLVFVWLLAAWALVSGALELRAAFNLATDHGRWWLALGGIISIVFGIVLVAAPMFGALAMTWWVGAYAIFFGATLVALAFQLRARKLGALATARKWAWQRPQQKNTKGYPITSSRDNERESKMENDMDKGPRPVGDAEMDAWRASLEAPESVAKAELHNYRAPKTYQQNRTTTDNVAPLEKLHDGFLKLTYQEKVLYVAASVIALMLIFPPTKKFYHEYYGSQIQVTYSYDFIFSLPGGESVNIDVLLIQWLGVGLVAAILYFAASKKKNESTSGRDDSCPSAATERQ